MAAGDLVIDTDAWRCSWHGREVPLSRQCFALLAHLASHPGQVWSRDQLLDACWSERRFVEPKTVDVHVRWLRNALAEVAGARIATVRGVGYRWEWEPTAHLADTFPRDLSTPRAHRQRGAAAPRNPGTNPAHPWRHDSVGAR